MVFFKKKKKRNYGSLVLPENQWPLKCNVIVVNFESIMQCDGC